MDSRLLQVLQICFPVFGLIGLGKILQKNNVMNAEHRHFVNRLVFNFSLPALIFRGVAKQELGVLLNPGLAVGALLPIALVTLLFLLLRYLLGYKSGYAAAFVFGSFWANVSYMGFPLARNAFGEAGFAAASVYNALVMPVFVVLGFLMIGTFAGDRAEHTFGRIVKRAFFNPVVLAACVGIGAAVMVEPLRHQDGGLRLPPAALMIFELGDSLLAMVGSMGLPLALLSVGAALQLKHAGGHTVPLALIVAGKLILVPLFSLLTFRYFLPLCGLEVTGAVMGTTVLLSAMPNAVASYVVACEIGVEEGFVSTMLVVTTCVSIAAIPVWLYVIV